MTSNPSVTPLLEVDGLTVRIDAPAGPLYPVRDVSFRLAPGETLGIVGESGCGKTLTCLSVIGLLGRRVAIERGSVRLDGVDLSGEAAARLRRRHVGVIFQSPMSSLNPVRTIGWQVAEAYRIRTGANARTAAARAVELLDLVGIPEPRRRARDYPHQLSGGQQQRAMIAMAIAGDPRLLIADEATTALDVTVQAQIVELLDRLRREIGMGMLFVTHDLGLVAEIADRVAVMYAGRIVELAPGERLFRYPSHPYSRGLLDSLPYLDDEIGRLNAIHGTVPPLDAMPAGCAFAARCGHAGEVCRNSDPGLAADGGGSLVACHKPRSEERGERLAS